MAQQNTIECAWNRFGITKGTLLRHGTAKHERVRMESVWHNQGTVTPPWHSKTRLSAHGIGLAQPRERYSAMAQQNTIECAWNRFGTTKGTLLRHGTAKHERVRMESVWHNQGNVTPPWHSKTRLSAHGIGLA